MHIVWQMHHPRTYKLQNR